MKSIDIANMFIDRFGDTIRITNLSLNKLVYFSQVESLRTRDKKPIFDDQIEAWAYGPVEPEVYRAFRRFGRGPVKRVDSNPASGSVDEISEAQRIVDYVAEKYGSLTAFDLVNLSHRENGAWRNRYVEGENVPIRIIDIIESVDFKGDIDYENTLSAKFREVRSKWPNALRMLEDA